MILKNLRKHAFTYIMLLIITVVFIINSIMDNKLNELGSSMGNIFATGELWRPFTSMFLHMDIMHFLTNFIGLLILGYACENVFGLRKTILFFFIAAILTALIEVLMVIVIKTQTTEVTYSIDGSVGASCGIFGLMGACFWIFTNKSPKERIKQIFMPNPENANKSSALRVFLKILTILQFVFILFYIAITLISPFTFVSHGFGFIVGLVLVWLFGNFKTTRTSEEIKQTK